MRYFIYNFIFLFTLMTFYTYPERERMIKLKPAQFKTENLKDLLLRRYSCRSYKDRILSLEEIGSILWAGLGKKFDALTFSTRTIPSAGGIYPLELFLLVGEGGVKELTSGLYRYIWEEHSLEPLILNKDLRSELSQACLNQDFIREAPVSLIIGVNYNLTTSRYGERGIRYVHLDTGHLCQNIYLAVTNLGLGTVEIGAFYDQEVKRLLRLDKELSPLIVMPIGHPNE